MKKWRNPKFEHGFFLNYEERLKMGRKIAEGGQAEIFDAKFKGDDRLFVLKVFKDARLEDLERLWPPQLLPLLYVDYEPSWMLLERHCCWIRGGTVLKDGRFAFLMDKYKGGDLRTYIDQRMQHWGYNEGPFEFSDGVGIMLQIAKGMRSLHRRGILHRDLKASNVLLRRHWVGFSLPSDFEIVIADFETSVGVFGTGFWRAPEVLLALKNRNFQPEMWTKKVDVYSYAMTCYEVITGHIPFEDLRHNDYDTDLNGGRPSVPDWYIIDSSEFYWNPVTRRRYPVPWVKYLLESCWDPNPLKRPSFDDIVKTLMYNTSEHRSFTEAYIRGRKVDGS